MKDRHPLIAKWVAEHARARDAFLHGKGDFPWGMDKQDYRKHRILSSVFFAVEKHGVLPGSRGYLEFHFEHQGTSTGALLVPLDGDRHNPHAKLRFIILDSINTNSTIYAEWVDGELSLEDRVPEIVAGILAATRAVARAQREHLKSLLDKEHVLILDGLKRLEQLGGDSFAARCDPRTFQALIEMAERHRSASLARRFLRSLSRSIADGSVIVAGHSLDDWMTWATAKLDEFDPLVQGPGYVFDKLVKA